MHPRLTRLLGVRCVSTLSMRRRGTSSLSSKMLTMMSTMAPLVSLPCSSLGEEAASGRESRPTKEACHFANEDRPTTPCQHRQGGKEE